MQQKNKGAYNVGEHILVPKHTKLSDKERKELLEKHGLTPLEMPKIPADDPAIEGIDVKDGDIIKIERISQTAGKSVFYRCVRNA